MRQSPERVDGILDHIIAKLFDIEAIHDVHFSSLKTSDLDQGEACTAAPAMLIIWVPYYQQVLRGRYRAVRERKLPKSDRPHSVVGDIFFHVAILRRANLEIPRLKVSDTSIMSRSNRSSILALE